MKSLHTLVILPVLCAGWISCSPKTPLLPNPHTVNKADPLYKNPFNPETFAHFVASKDYPSTYHIFIRQDLLSKPNPHSQKIIICLDQQRGRYYINDQVAMDFPTSTGVKSFPTKLGDYKVISKKVDHHSNLYGRMYDADGKCIDGDAESSDTIPEGGKFVPSPMPYWQRLTNAGLGLHVGKVGRRPLSHGCIRLNREVAETLYKKTTLGTPVKIIQHPEPVSDADKQPYTKPKSK